MDTHDPGSMGIVMVDEDTLGGLIRRRRIERRLTQGDLGDAIGKPQNFISRLENARLGEAPPPPEVLNAIAAVLETDVREFLQVAGYDLEDGTNSARYVARQYEASIPVDIESVSGMIKGRLIVGDVQYVPDVGFLPGDVTSYRNQRGVVPMLDQDLDGIHRPIVAYVSGEEFRDRNINAGDRIIIDNAARPDQPGEIIVYRLEESTYLGEWWPVSGGVAIHIPYQPPTEDLGERCGWQLLTLDHDWEILGVVRDAYTRKRVSAPVES